MVYAMCNVNFNHEVLSWEGKMLSDTCNVYLGNVVPTYLPLCFSEPYVRYIYFLAANLQVRAEHAYCSSKEIGFLSFSTWLE